MVEDNGRFQAVKQILEYTSWVNMDQYVFKSKYFKTKYASNFKYLAKLHVLLYMPNFRCSNIHI